MTAIEIPTPDPRTLDDAARPFAEAISAQYAVKRLIGRGGMGMVYLARDRRLDRLVAIKTLPPNLAKDPALRERFLRETRAAGAMSHPNIVPIHGADEIDGHVFFVMGFVEGDSLAAHTRANGRLAPRAVAPYLRDVALALMHAHQRGIIHRDIKAENILIDRASGRALVTDFGIARLAEATPLTVTGQLLGTVYYVSPEQVSGDRVDARSDIYSLGVVGFLALTGQFPFDAEVASAVLVAHVTKAAPPVASINPAIPSGLAGIIDRCLMKDPAHRYASSADLAAALEAAIPDLDRPMPALPSLISDTEAHAVWRRAAELQAMTGVQPRPAAIAKERDEAKDRARREGFGLGEVRVAAVEAGIADTYVEHALAEHGLAPGRAVAPPPKPVARAVPERRSFWAGAPVDVVRETRIEGEIAARDVEIILNAVRDNTRSLGTVSARTRELAWQTGGIGSRLDVSVVPETGRTTVRVARSLRRKAVAILMTSYLVIGTVSGPMVGASIYEIFGRDSEPFAVLLGLATAATLPLWIGRKVFRWFRQRAIDRVAKLGERIERTVAATIAAESSTGKKG